MTGNDDDNLVAILRRMGIRPTRQRLTILGVLHGMDTTHVTADQVHAVTLERRTGLPLATVYNVLNDFAKAGMMRRLGFAERTTFCTNPAPHHHYLDVATNALFDIPGPQPSVGNIPTPPEGMEIEGIDVIIRLRECGRGHKR